MRIDKQFAINILEQYIIDQKNIQEISGFAFDTISSDEDLVDEQDFRLLIEIIVYLDNIDNGMFLFSKLQARFLISILESPRGQEIDIELVNFVKFRNEIIQFLTESRNIKEKIMIINKFKEFGFNNNSANHIAKFVTSNNRDKLICLIETGNTRFLGAVIANRLLNLLEKY